MGRAVEYMLVALFLILFFNMVVVFKISSDADEKISAVKEQMTPAAIQLTTINAPCKECGSVEGLLREVRALKVNITQEELLDWAVNDTASGNTADNVVQVVETYNIQRLPAVVVKGEVAKLFVSGAREAGGALVIEAAEPPYFDVKEQAVKGRVAGMVIFDKKCEQCANLTTIIKGLQQDGVFFARNEESEASDSKSKAIISKYGVKQLPTLILSSDIDEYAAITQNIRRAGINKTDGSYVIYGPPPYVNLTTNRIAGLINVVKVVDGSCTACSDADDYAMLIGQLGLAIDKETEVDVATANGKEVKQKYDLRKVPTIMLVGDIDAYPGFDLLWLKVGSIEKDGTLVLRNPEAVIPTATFRNLTTGAVVGPLNESVEGETG